MSASYILRFDDICPTMNWRVWNEVEHLLIQHDISPILAVVPDNRDSKLEVDQCDVNFWDRVRAWNSRGWTIALHGYQHRYVTSESGIVGINKYSEFAGLPYDEQLSKLQAAMAIFSQQGLQPRVWVAPAHSFDLDTLRALHEVGIDTISDGFALRAYTDKYGRFWIPQQLWRFRPMPFGVWTVCAHVNSWSASDVLNFSRDIARYAPQVVSLSQICERFATRRRTFADAIFDSLFRRKHLLIRRLAEVTSQN